ncbi:hypothetical protein Hamer_G025916, partial [Homarus americanus]
MDHGLCLLYKRPSVKTLVRPLYRLSGRAEEVCVAVISRLAECERMCSQRGQMVQSRSKTRTYPPIPSPQIVVPLIVCIICGKLGKTFHRVSTTTQDSNQDFNMARPPPGS